MREILQLRHIEIPLVIPSEENIFSVAGQAHHFDPRPVRALQTEAFPHGIFVGPQFFRHGLVHHRD